MDQAQFDLPTGERGWVLFPALVADAFVRRVRRIEDSGLPALAAAVRMT
jgi:hypothetical protein